MKTRYRDLIRIFFLLSLLMISVCILAVIVVDPFFHYHKPVNGMYYVIDNQINQNPGIARNLDYDSVILGSSMTVNFDTDLFAKAMELNTVKLSYNGAYPKDIDNIMQIVEKKKDRIRQVFLGIDIYTYKASPGICANPIPTYLYDDSLINDIPYLLNKDVLLKYIMMPQITRESTPLNETYWFWRDVPCGADKVIAQYERPADFAKMQPAGIYQSNIEKNMRTYILPYIETMPETQFTVFFPPYSILYWYSRYADGSLSAELAGEKQIMELLLSYPNVRVYYFQNNFDFITNLDNYSDYTHYTHEMNDQMTRWFAQQDCPYEVTSGNYGAVLDAMERWLMLCDFESYLIY
ncbi:MAG: hypothetical protein J1E01_07240 [Acetatifactor sp.]|nr:hypothetical protein [Acetatifactor sp.]